jgi:hypothetical protein
MSSTPDSPAKMPDDRTTQGRNYWTLFIPGIWKLLHAVLQPVSVICPTAAITPAKTDTLSANARANILWFITIARCAFKVRLIDDDAMA